MKGRLAWLFLGLAVFASHGCGAVHPVGRAAPVPAPMAAVPGVESTPRTTLVCLADPDTREVEVVVAQRGADGVLRHVTKGAEPLTFNRNLEAARTSWYASAEPIVWNGRTYRAGKEWRETALRRYLRPQGAHRGVPLFSLWPSGDRTLAILVSQEGCTFRSYEPAE